MQIIANSLSCVRVVINYWEWFVDIFGWFILNRYHEILRYFYIFATKNDMRILKTVAHYSDGELLKIWKSQTEVRAYQDWQIIYSVQVNLGKEAIEFAQMLGVKASKVKAVIQKYNKSGKDWRKYGKWGGRREERCLLSLEEEKSLLSGIESEALAGKILIYQHIKGVVEERVGAEVSDDYIWDLFKRHNWTKKVPRPSHPKADKEAQQEYKKNSRSHWKPNY